MMSRRPLLALAALFALSTTVAAAQTPIPSPPAIQAAGYILIDSDSGRVLAEERADEHMEPASITKLLTGYIVFEALREKRLALADPVVISENAWRAGGAASGGSTTFLEVGSEVPVEILIQGMIVQSGNDATIALAEKLGGTEDGFVQIMNEYARRLGMTNSHFQNSWGGPAPQHYSSARDLAILSRAIIREFPDYYRWYSQREFTWNNVRQTNRNGLLYRDSTVDGIKTGHTNSAKYCLASSAIRDGMRLISVVLGSPTQRAREDASSALLNYGFTFYETVKLQEGGTALLTPQVFKGSAGSVAVGTKDDVSVTIPRGQSAALTKEALVDGPLVAPLAAGATVGEYVVQVGDATVARVPLVTLSAVDEGGLFGNLLDTVRLWFE